VGDFNFARASAATRINKYGLIETVASSQSRLNYPLIDGVVKGCPHHILEPVRTNLITYSQSFSNWTASDLTVTDNNSISPDGSLNASKLTLTSGTSVKRIALGSMPTSSALRCYSIFFKTNDINSIQLLHSGDLQGYANFDLVNSVVGTSGSKTTSKIENYGNGWYRCTAIFDNTNAFGSVLYLYIKDNALGTYGGSTSEVGDLFIFGAMYEEGSYPTSYIVSNSGSATTRVAETANGAGDASTFNDSEGVLFAEIAGLVDGGSGNNYLILSDKTTSNNIIIQYANNGGLFLSNTGSTFYINNDIDLTQNIKLAIKYGTSTSDYKVYLDGFERDIESGFSATALSGIDDLSFEYVTGSNQFNGKTKQLQYFDSVLNDTELETLTSWVSFQDMAEGQLYTIE
jgi:hypothetical protein